MTTTKIWLTVIAIGIITFLLRFSFIFLFGKIQLPASVRRALRFVPVTVLPALIAPEFFYQNQNLEISLNNDRLIAGIIALLVALRTKNGLLTIVVGMVFLWILQAIS